MQIDITGHRIKVTDALRERVRRALADIDGRNHRYSLQHAHVVVEVDGNSHHCLFKVNSANGAFVAKDAADDMYVAISRAAGKIERQLTDSANRRQRQ